MNIVPRPGRQRAAAPGAAAVRGGRADRVPHSDPRRNFLMSRHRLVAGAIAGVAALALTLGSAAITAETISAAYAGDTTPLAATAGCGKAPTLTSGTRTIQSGGQNRSFILRIPDNYDRNHPYRLIFGFHWNGGTANDVDSGGTSGYPWSYYGLRALSNNSTIFVAPQGIGNGWANPGGAGPHLRRRHDQADRGGPVRRHDAAVRPGLQLRRRHELRHRLRPGHGLPRGRGLLRRAAQRVQRRHPADRVHRASTASRDTGAAHLRRTVAARPVRPEQRLHRRRTRPSRRRAA